MNPRRNHGERGQGLVEFAVIFPIFVILVFTVLDVGIAMQRRGTLQHAAREGARYAATRDNSDGGAFVIDRTVDQAQDLVDPGDVCISFEDMDGGEIGPGDAVDVDIDYQYKPFIMNSVLSLVGANVPDIDMGVTGSARLEVPLDNSSGGCG